MPFALLAEPESAALVTALGTWVAGKRVQNQMSAHDQSKKAQAQADQAPSGSASASNCQGCDDPDPNDDNKNKKRENKKKHLFGKPEHYFDRLLKSFGGDQDKALDAIQSAAQKMGQGGSGRFSGVANINGYDVTIRGAMINGHAEIVTDFIL